MCAASDIGHLHYGLGALGSASVALQCKVCARGAVVMVFCAQICLLSRTLLTVPVASPCQRLHVPNYFGTRLYAYTTQLSGAWMVCSCCGLAIRWYVCG